MRGKGVKGGKHLAWIRGDTSFLPSSPSSLRSLFLPCQSCFLVVRSNRDCPFPSIVFVLVPIMPANYGGSAVCLSRKPIVRFLCVPVTCVFHLFHSLFIYLVGMSFIWLIIHSLALVISKLSLSHSLSLFFVLSLSPSFITFLFSLLPRIYYTVDCQGRFTFICLFCSSPSIW